MRLEDLLAFEGPDIDRLGGRIALDLNIASARKVERRFNALIQPLRDQEFWKAAREENDYRPDRGLWAPQRRAVGLSAAYISAWREGLAKDEAALVKMPTGSGKTAVIATLSCALPGIKRTLVITPRRSLVDQMHSDLHVRFWHRFDQIYDGKRTRARTEDDVAPDGVRRQGPVWRLLPKSAKKILEIEAERVVLVGTFTALEQILRPERPAHRLSGRSTGEGMGGAPGEALIGVGDEDLNRLAAFLRTFDLVLVDESHYEPAYVWSQCIRSLNLPTVLFSATPYRNDFKYFAISGRFAFNLSFQEAQQRQLIRPVDFLLGADFGAGEGDFVSRLDLFEREVIKPRAKLPKGVTPKTIVRVDSHDTIVRLQGEIKRRIKQDVVLIHDRESNATAEKLRFNSVTAALRAPQTSNISLWLHQWKLLEGVDESSFAGIAVYDELPSTRAIVQQVGRVLRYAGRGREKAFVMAAPAFEVEMLGRWQRYLEYEAYFDRDPSEALTREAAMLKAAQAAAPELQYLGGDFRNRLDLDGEDIRLSDFQLPRRATIMRNSGALTLDEIAIRCSEAMSIEDRYQAFVLHPGDGEPENVRLIPYVLWATSELLRRHALQVLSFGLMAVVSTEKRIFLMDSQRLVIDPDRLGLEQESVATLQRLMPVQTKKSQARVTQASAVSLDLSDVSIRSITARMRDFNEGFFDLAETMQAATAMRAHIRKANEKRATVRYLSLQRSSVSDGAGEYVSVDDYVEWIQGLDQALTRPGLTSRAFSRFAQAQPTPSKKDAEARNVLFDFLEIVGEGGEITPPGWDQKRVKDLLEADRCLDVRNEKFSVKVGTKTFEGELKYGVTGRIRRRGRYVVTCEELDKFMLESGHSEEDKISTVSNLLTREQCFRVVPVDVGLVYAQRHFYKPSIDLKAIEDERSGGNPLEAVTASAWLQVVDSEKGHNAPTDRSWAEKSIFGGIYALKGFGARGEHDSTLTNSIRKHDASLADELDKCSLIVCDDGSKEFCDFACLDDDARRLVLIHAKSGKSKASLNALQEVGRQALASLAFLTRAHAPKSRATRWTDPVPLKPTAISRRILSEISADDAWDAVETAMRSVNYRREVWIMAGKTLSRGALKDRLAKVGPSEHDLQILYYLSALETSMARANVRLRVFCSP